MKRVTRRLKRGVWDAVRLGERAVYDARSFVEVAGGAEEMRRQLRRLFSGDSTLDVPAPSRLDLSIILVVVSRPALALACIRSVLASQDLCYELVIVDDGSTRGMKKLLGRINNAKIVANDRCLGYPEALRRGVDQARGEYLLFLEANTRLSPGGVESALKLIRSNPDIGAVGGKTLFAAGGIEEAGSILWSDGSYQAYGRGDRVLERRYRYALTNESFVGKSVHFGSHKPEYAFVRDIDFVSGPSLLTRRGACEGWMIEVGEPPPSLRDERNDRGMPVVEKADYGIWLWERGLRIVYDPRMITHRLAGDPSRSARRQRGLDHDPERLLRDHPEWLRSQQRNSAASILSARSHGVPPLRVLYLDDRVPHASLGSGLPRTRRIISAMVELGYFVTYYPLEDRREDWAEVYEALDPRVEVMVGYAFWGLIGFLKGRSNYYDVIFLSRPHNMENVKPFLAEYIVSGRPKVVYDAEALFCLRTIEKARLSDIAPDPEESRSLIEREVRLADGCAAVVSVSEKEGRNFVERGFANVHILGHPVEPTPTPLPFGHRQNILFVGGIYSMDTPNADSVAWFLREIFPSVRARLGPDVHFLVAGTVSPPEVLGSGGQSVRFLGRVDDLTPIYNDARLFVAPTRFAAGIPLKLIEAAAHGVPTVTTSLLASQLGWRDGVELLVADAPGDFADRCASLYEDRELWDLIRENALAKIRESSSGGAYSATLRKIVETTLGGVGHRS